MVEVYGVELGASDAYLWDLGLDRDVANEHDNAGYDHHHRNEGADDGGAPDEGVGVVARAQDLLWHWGGGGDWWWWW